MCDQPGHLLLKYYKRYAARVRVNQIKEDAFKKWKYQAIALPGRVWDWFSLRIEAAPSGYQRGRSGS